MPSPIRRLVQLVFDRNSAKKTEQEAKRSLGGVEKSLGRLKSAALKVGAALGAAFVVDRIRRWTTEALRAGVSAEETFSKFNTVFGEGADLVDAFVEDFRTMAGITRTEGREMVATAGAIAQGFGLSQQASGEFAARMVSLAGDLQSFNDVPIEETFAAIRSGLTETEPLKRFGIVIRQADVEMRALAETGKRTKDELTEQEKVVARLNLIYEKAGVAVGDLERTQNSTANTIRRLVGAWRQLQESVGVAIISSNDATGIMGQLIRVLEGLTMWVDRNRDAFSLLGGMLGNLVTVAGFLAEGLGRVSNALAGFTSGLLSGALRLISRFVEGMTLATRATAGLLDLIGADETAARVDNLTRRLERQVERLKFRSKEEEEIAAALLRRAFAQREVNRAEAEAPGGAPTGDGAPPPPKAPTIDPSEQKALAKAQAEADKITESLRSRSEIYLDTIRLLKGHLDAGRISQETYNRGVDEAREAFLAAGDAAETGGNRVADALTRHQQSLDATRTLAQALGDDYDALEEEARSIESTLRVLAEEGLDPTDERFAALVDRLAQVRQGMRLTGDEAMEMGQVATAAGDLIGAAFGSGIGPLAAAKAKQNAILAAEHAVQALVATLNPFTAGTAGAHLAASAKFAAISAAWATLAGSAGGFNVGGGGGGSVGSPGFGRDQGGPGSERMGPVGPEVHVHFVGPGFDAVNPEVQRVVHNAGEFARQRFGENTRVKVHRRGR